MSCTPTSPSSCRPPTSPPTIATWVSAHGRPHCQTGLVGPYARRSETQGIYQSGQFRPLRALPALLEALSKPARRRAHCDFRTNHAAPRARRVCRRPAVLFTETAGQARVVVSHGGSGGLYPAIAAGTPVLGIPSNADQQLSTAVLEESGAGLGVRVEEASERRLSQALKKLLFDPQYHRSAQQWATVYQPLRQWRHVRAISLRHPGHWTWRRQSVERRIFASGFRTGHCRQAEKRSGARRKSTGGI